MNRRRVSTSCLNDGFSRSVSARALIMRWPIDRSDVQDGTSPQRIDFNSLWSLFWIITGTSCDVRDGVARAKLVNLAAKVPQSLQLAIIECSAETTAHIILSLHHKSP